MKADEKRIDWIQRSTKVIKKFQKFQKKSAKNIFLTYENLKPTLKMFRKKENSIAI